MRISGGNLRGRQIPSPPGRQTRPTTERVREALFSMLAGHLDGAVVLDLFAGSGLLGLEALSRGARMAWFVEHHPPTGQRLRQILNDFQLSDRAGVMVGPADAATLQRVIAQATLKVGGHVAFNLVLMDPPYGQGWVEKTLAMLPEQGMLAPHAVAVVEHEATANPAAMFHPPWRLWKTRRHGATGLTLLLLDDTVPSASPTATPQDDQNP